MKSVQVRRQSDGLLFEVALAETILEKAKGLIAAPRSLRQSGLWIPECSSIHMWFMGFAIDALFIKRDKESWVIAQVFEDIQPWKALPVSAWGADAVIELEAGRAKALRLVQGDILCTS